jgi:N-acetylmuramic acid 6-phosphate (MurNAc-6-P) etherase
MKLVERSENLVYELTKEELERAIRTFIGLGSDYRLEALDIHHGNDQTAATAMLARDIDTP